ncbi:hypothetical protein SAMN03097699_1251 [Flavobacteriaceae bacterium MAR_2010_188]|nr:hypothetical protein SAMN03097699_1251 [Flavobacteriaceae bacterium MAR_2010_188]
MITNFRLKLLVITVLITGTIKIYAQEEIKDFSDKDLKESIIRQINDSRKTDFAKFERKISISDSIITKLDNEISELKNTSEKIDNFSTRINALEDKEQAIRNKELSSFSSNYKTAVINLAFLESDLKPLSLFQSTRTFFTTLNKTSNPMSYPDYQSWYAEFKDYLEKKQSKDAKLSVLYDMLKISSDLSRETPLTGPLVGAMFDGISNFINSLGSSKKDLREKSEKMMKLTMVLGQYTHETTLIENEWDAIDGSLKELQKLYEEYLNYNLELIGETRANFEKSYITETDGMKKLTYLNKLKDKAGTRVQNERNTNSKKWKQSFFYEMEKVQSLKLRFGEITQRIKQNFDKYNKLIKSYEKNEFMAANMKELKERLEDMQSNFSESFVPEDYINDANVMYIID